MLIFSRSEFGARLLEILVIAKVPDEKCRKSYACTFRLIAASNSSHFIGNLILISC